MIKVIYIEQFDVILMSGGMRLIHYLPYNLRMTTEVISKPFPVAGVVFAWAMPSSGNGYEIPLFEIASALEDPNLSIWLHLNLSNLQIQR